MKFKPCNFYRAFLCSLKYLQQVFEDTKLGNECVSLTKAKSIKHS